MAQFVTTQEAALAALVGRRVLNHQRVAEKEGEKYVDLAPLAPVGCGIRVKVRFIATPNGYTPVAHLKAPSTFSREEVKTAAEELLGGSVLYVEDLDDGTVVYQKETP